jgi:tetratricopeptide (TPR) repeat protein
MNETQPDPSNEQTPPSLPSTEPDLALDDASHADVGKAGSRTCQLFPADETPASATGGLAGAPHGGNTRSVDPTIPPEQTKHLSTVPRTLEASSGDDRAGTLVYSVQSHAGEDTERTLPPGAETPAGIRPKVAGYEILDVLGEGGMGIVFKARHVRLGRLVALKMIRSGAGVRPADLARFEAEAQAVAAIEQPNIVHIFEIGEHGGMPYFSLEYLSAGSLAKVIGGKPQSPAEAARIVSTLAGAADVAHKRGIIHRDLKPANVPLSHDGTLKITDFGLVKRLESDSSQTRTGSILGTPSYMSPEQARGETHNVGPAADQYALGAILYELLTGRPPFHGTSVLDTLDQVRQKEPVPPSQLQTKVPRDLETICLKCLEKDPARRYSDVAALREDLRRYREDKPIVARPVCQAERLWRWCLRNRAVAALGAIVATILACAAVGGTAAAFVISRQNRGLREANIELDKARKIAEVRRVVAESKQQLAEQAAQTANLQNKNAVETEVAMLSLLEDRLRFVPGIENVRTEMLIHAIKSLDEAGDAMIRLRKEIGWPPEEEDTFWRTLARAHQRFGEVSLSLNRFSDAMKQFKLMDQIIETLAKADPGDTFAQFRLARTRRQLGAVAMQKLGDSATGQSYLRQAIEINRACLAKKPDDDVFKRELANSLGQLATSVLMLGHLEKARELYEEEVGVRKSFSAAMANDYESRAELAGLYERLSELKVRTNELDDGRLFLDKCAEIRKQLVDENPGQWPDAYNLARCYNSAGKMELTLLGKPAAARELHRQALAVIEERAKADPANLET